MADLIVMRPSFVPTVPEGPGRWEPGMIVDVFPDGQLGPGTQQHPRFFIVRIPGVPESDVRDLIAVLMDESDPANPILLKKREWTLDTANVPGPILTQIENDREITVTESQFRSFVKKVT